MTLILTLLHGESVTQASDLRITKALQPVGHQRKMIHYRRHGMRTVVAWTGLAALGATESSAISTEDWLIDHLHEGSGRSLGEDLFRLTRELDEQMAGARWVRKDQRRITVTMAGFGMYPEPVMVTISNWQPLGEVIPPVHDGPIRPAVLDSAAPEFRSGEFSVYAGFGSVQTPVLFGHGDLSGVTDSIRTHLWRAIKSAIRAGARELAFQRLLAAAIEDIGFRGEQDGTIGKQAWAATVHRDSIVGSFNRYGPEDGGEFGVLPTLIAGKARISPWIDGNRRV